MKIQRSKEVKNIAVLGVGSWGMTLALILRDNKYNVKIWDIDQERIKKISLTRRFDLLPWIRIPKSIELSLNLNEICTNADLIIFAIPSHAIRSVAELVKKQKIKDLENKIILSVAKGIECDTYLNMTEILHDVLKVKKDMIYALSGPTHAEEVSKKLLTTVAIVGVNDKILNDLQNIFSNSYFRVYISKDIKGVELGGAAKNVIAIATGIADGLGLGDNTKAALITRGLVEIARLGKKIGAKPETFYGLSGLGDLVVTCISKHSRNRYFGEELGKGKKIKTILSEMKMVVEGINAAKSINKLAKIKNIDMPIVNEVYDIIYNKKSPKDAVFNLMKRKLKTEKIF